MPIQREISPAINATVEQYLLNPQTRPEVRLMVEEIRRQKATGTRPHPSSSLTGSSSLLTTLHRRALIDMIAAQVDENCCGRSDMCQQFADLLHRALTHLKFPSRPVTGWAMYLSSEGKELFRWRHAWVRVSSEVIDGNTDTLSENPEVPPNVMAVPYWGPIKEVPGRRLQEAHGELLPSDTDVSEIWWPDLRAWLDTEFLEL